MEPDAFSDFLKDVASKIDFEAFFASLPEEEFRAMINDRMEKIDAEEREIATAEARVASYRREAEGFQAALRIKRELEERHQREQAVAIPLPVQPIPPPRELMQRKRAAVLRIVRTDPTRLISPDDMEDVLLQRGLLSEAEIRAGTPIRVVMAKLRADNVLERPTTGRYRLAVDSGVERNGASPRVQTEDPPMPQKPPDEEIASPRPGHPIGEGSAEVASRF